VLLRTSINGFDGRTLLLSNGETVQNEHAGVGCRRIRRCAPGIGWPEQSRGGGLPVTPTLQVSDHPELYVTGDLAHLEQGGAIASTRSGGCPSANNNGPDWRPRWQKAVPRMWPLCGPQALPKLEQLVLKFQTPRTLSARHIERVEHTFVLARRRFLPFDGSEAIPPRR
jgi:hypothetical protein